MLVVSAISFRTNADTSTQGVKNIVFHAGKAEDVLQSAIAKLPASQNVALKQHMPEEHMRLVVCQRLAAQGYINTVLMKNENHSVRLGIQLICHTKDLFIIRHLLRAQRSSLLLGIYKPMR